MTQGSENNTLKLKRLGIDTRYEHVVYMRADCAVCRSEGFDTLSRVLVRYNGKRLIATLNSVHGDLLQAGEVSISESAWQSLEAEEGHELRVEHMPPVESLSYVRAKLYGHRLHPQDYSAIIDEINAGQYSNTQLAAFISACVGNRLGVDEIISLTRAMIDVGDCLTWPSKVVMDKHCVGGLPGNRTTPIVVPIVAAAGLTIPKTSSRAITSPSGTADCMEVMTRVRLTPAQMREVVEKEGGCLVWGGAVNLSPVDDVLIRVERSLDVDSEGQLIASVLSKKAASGSTHVVIDIPVGDTAKVRTQEAAEALKAQLMAVGSAVGLELKVMLTDGSQPIGRGIGPALEARDVLAVLRNKAENLPTLRSKSIALAAEILELAGHCPAGQGALIAEALLRNGEALNKFMAICEAQGGFREPELASYRHNVLAERSGRLKLIDNRRLAKVAKFAGAPLDHGAGLELFKRLGEQVSEGEPIYCIYSDSQGELNYAVDYVRARPSIIQIED